MPLIIRRPSAFPDEELRRTFEREGNIQAIVDGRYGERGTTRQPVALQRQGADRRRVRERLAETPISDYNEWSRPIDEINVSYLGLFFLKNRSKVQWALDSRSDSSLGEAPGYFA